MNDGPLIVQSDKTLLLEVDPVALVRGEGVRLFDADGREYYDLLSGIGVAALGHGHPALARAVAVFAPTALLISLATPTIPDLNGWYAMAANRLLSLPWIHALRPAHASCFRSLFPENWPWPVHNCRGPWRRNRR